MGLRVPLNSKRTTHYGVGGRRRIQFYEISLLRQQLLEKQRGWGATSRWLFDFFIGFGFEVVGRSKME